MICKDSTKSENNSPLNYGQCQEEAREYEQSDKLGETVGGDPSPDTIEKGCGRFPNCLHSSIDECLQNKQGVNQDDCEQESCYCSDYNPKCGWCKENA